MQPCDLGMKLYKALPTLHNACNQYCIVKGEGLV